MKNKERKEEIESENISTEKLASTTALFYTILLDILNMLVVVMVASLILNQYKLNIIMGTLLLCVILWPFSLRKNLYYYAKQIIQTRFKSDEEIEKYFKKNECVQVVLREDLFPDDNLILEENEKLNFYAIIKEENKMVEMIALRNDYIEVLDIIYQKQFYEIFKVK